MLLRCLRAELIKFRRSPVWLAFVVLPVFPAILGTMNYLGNLGLLQSEWYSLWSQHTLFSSMFFLPACWGLFCAWQWRLEHTDHNWNSFLTAPVPVGALCLAKLIWAAVMSLLSRPGSGYCLSSAESWWASPVPSRGATGVAAVRGRGRRVGVRGAALFQPDHPGVRSTRGFWAGGGHSGAAGHSPGFGYAFPYSLLCIGMRANNPNMELDFAPFLLSAFVYTAVFTLLAVRYLRRHDVAAE